MGYYIFSYGIKADQVQKAFGSKDARLLAQVKSNGIFQNYLNDCDADDGIVLEQALDRLIAGEALDQSAGYAYGYATIGLCATLGTELPSYGQEIKLGYETDLINEVLAEDFGITDLLIEEVLLPDNSHLFPLPKITDWPIIGLVRKQQLQALSERLASLAITVEQIAALEDDPDEKGIAYEYLLGITDAVNFCVAHGLDLISFCH